MCAKSRMTISSGNVFTFCTNSFKWIYSSKGPFVLFNYFGQWSMSNQTTNHELEIIVGQVCLNYDHVFPN